MDEPPAGDWITEVKWDGYRTQIVKERSGYTRNGHDWSTRYWPITLTASAMPFKSGIIDGEVVVLDEQHRSSFNELQASFPAAGRAAWCSLPSTSFISTAWTFASCLWWCGGSA